MIRRVFIVTHGSIEGAGNPHLTGLGRAQLVGIADFLPGRPARIITGTGARHQGMVEAMGLQSTCSSELLGRPEMIQQIGDQQGLVLADGTVISPFKLPEQEDTGELHALILSLPDETVLLTDPSVAGQLGMIDPQQATVYEVEHDGFGIRRITRRIHPYPFSVIG